VLGVNEKFKTPEKRGFLALRSDLVEALGYFPMCNLYSITKGQAAIGAFTRAMRDRTGKGSPRDYRSFVVRRTVQKRTGTIP
jgi:hypothetical protein